MTLKYKLIAVAALLVAGLIIGNAVHTHFLIAGLERRVDDAKQLADQHQRRANDLEHQTHIYKEKAAYLEARLTEIETAAREQDETLEKLSADTAAARRDLQRHRERAK